jgi:hypothetical protein
MEQLTKESDYLNHSRDNIGIIHYPRDNIGVIGGLFNYPGFDCERIGEE